MSKRFIGEKKYILYCNGYYEGYLYNTSEVQGRIQEHYKTRKGDLHVEIDNDSYPLFVFDTFREACVHMGIQIYNGKRYFRSPLQNSKLFRIAKAHSPEYFV